MLSHLTGFFIAGAVVAGLLGLMSLNQDDFDAVEVARIQGMETSELYQVARDADAEHRLEAILRLGKAPGNLAETVPLLAELLIADHELTRSAAELALREIGSEGAQYLQPMMDSDEEVKLVQACTALKFLGDGSKFYLPQFIQWLKRNDSVRHRMALYALQGAGVEALPALDLVIDRLDDQDFNLQCMACRVLENLGPDAMPAEEALLHLLNEGNPSARSWASVALGAMGPTDKTDMAKILGSKLDAFLQIDKQRALLGIAHLGPEAASIEDDVRRLMNDNSKHVMPHAAYALWKITGNAQESLDVMAKLIQQPDYADDTIELAGTMRSEAAPLVDLLIKRLVSEEPHDRELAVVTLGNIGPPAVAAIPHIQKLLQDNDALIRYAAGEALNQIESQSPEPQK